MAIDRCALVSQLAQNNKGEQLRQSDDTKGKQLQRTDELRGRLPVWIVAWFYLTSIICTWDATFIMLRPYSLPGGSLSWIWFLYKHYVSVDQRYADTKDGFVYAQSLLNYVEVILNIITIYMHYKCSRHTVAAAFTVNVMTWWKTVLYFLMFTDLCEGGQYRVGNTAADEFFLVIIPNGVWIVLPLAAMVALWHRLDKSSLGQMDMSLLYQDYQGQGSSPKENVDHEDQSSHKREAVRVPGSHVFSLIPGEVRHRTTTEFL